MFKNFISNNRMSNYVERKAKWSRVFGRNMLHLRGTALFWVLSRFVWTIFDKALPTGILTATRTNIRPSIHLWQNRCTGINQIESTMILWFDSRSNVILPNRTRHYSLRYFSNQVEVSPLICRRVLSCHTRSNTQHFIYYLFLWPHI